MKDIELLILAAKSIDVDHVDYAGLDYDGSLGLQMVDGVGRHTGTWNPLKDNADAFFLAAMLGLDLEFHGLKGVHPYACAFDCERNIAEEVQLNSGDILATARRCIVQAAAKMGSAQ